MTELQKTGFQVYDIKEALFKGVNAHSDERIEHLVIGIKTGSTDVLKAHFGTLCHRLVGKGRYRAIQYAGVWVATIPNPHAHVFWIKPYIRYEHLEELWRDITKDGTVSIRTTTIKGDKSRRNDVRRIVYYVAEQTQHHGVLTHYYQSQRWLIRSRKFEKSGQMELGDAAQEAAQ